MNDHDRPIPAGAPPKLQALDLAALRGLGDTLDALVCDIDDPDCEAPALAPVESDRRRTEVLDAPPEGLDALDA